MLPSLCQGVASPEGYVHLSRGPKEAAFSGMMTRFNRRVVARILRAGMLLLWLCFLSSLLPYSLTFPSQVSCGGCRSSGREADLSQIALNVAATDHRETRLCGCH